MEVALFNIRKIDHPAAKIVAGVIQTLMALGTISSMRVWLARELPKLNGDLARLAAQHSEIKAAIDIIINAVNSPA